MTIGSTLLKREINNKAERVFVIIKAFCIVSHQWARSKRYVNTLWRNFHFDKIWGRAVQRKTKRNRCLTCEMKKAKTDFEWSVRVPAADSLHELLVQKVTATAGAPPFLSRPFARHFPPGAAATRPCHRLSLR